MEQNEDGVIKAAFWSPPEYECSNGHSGPIGMSFSQDGKAICVCCALCFGLWAAKQFPVTNT